MDGATFAGLSPNVQEFPQHHSTSILTKLRKLRVSRSLFFSLSLFDLVFVEVDYNLALE